MRLAEKIALSLGISEGKVGGIAAAASHSYKTFTIPKKNGKHRTIHHPSKVLKAVQRWLLHAVIRRLPVSSAATAYESGSSIRKNAEIHRGARFAVRIDLADFYPSITSADFDAYAGATPALAGWTKDDLELFKQLVFKDGRLTVGAPTSPSLSNRLCVELDRGCAAFALSIGAKFSRFADDLVFSTVAPDRLGVAEEEVCSVISRLRYPAGLSVNAAKTQHFSRKHGIYVTGLTIGSDGEVYLGRSRKRRIRALIHKIDRLEPPDRLRLAGYLSFAKSVDGEFINALVHKYGADVIDRVQHPFAT